MRLLRHSKFVLAALLDTIFDEFSSRLCFSCKENFCNRQKEFFCDQCLNILILEFKNSYKQFSAYELSQVFELPEPIVCPKIYFPFYYNESFHLLVRDAKYRKPHYCKYLGRLLWDFWKVNQGLILIQELETVGLNKFVIGSSDLPINIFISPIPMHPIKKKQRIYNPAELIARSFFSLLKRFFMNDPLMPFQSSFGLNYHFCSQIIFCADLLVRRKNTMSLFSLKKAQRISILQSCFEINQNLQIEVPAGLNILLIIDDITTTGTTLIEAWKTVNQSGFFSEIIGLSVCGNN